LTVLGQEDRFFMSIDCDRRAQAQAAMQWAAAATSECERLEWVRIALAWHDLAPTCARLPGIWLSAGTLRRYLPTINSVQNAPCAQEHADNALTC
jgi:hypothetical protein